MLLQYLGHSMELILWPFTFVHFECMIADTVSSTLISFLGKIRSHRKTNLPSDEQRLCYCGQ